MYATQSASIDERIDRAQQEIELGRLAQRIDHHVATTEFHRAERHHIGVFREMQHEVEAIDAPAEQQRPARIGTCDGDERKVAHGMPAVLPQPRDVGNRAARHVGRP